MSAVRLSNFKDRFLEVRGGRQIGDGYQKLSYEFSLWPSAMGCKESVLSDGMDSPVFLRNICVLVFIGVEIRLFNVRSPT
jgi:hypothetical protein